jgi:hypothetical protein
MLTTYTTDCPAAFALAVDVVLDEIELGDRARDLIAALEAGANLDDLISSASCDPDDDDTEPDDGAPTVPAIAGAYDYTRTDIITAELVAFSRLAAELRGRALLEAAP